MNKYIIIGVVLVAIFAGGIGFSLMSEDSVCTEGVGTERNITVVSKKLEWVFEPEEISVEQCDEINLTVINEDNFDHGIAIDAFGISQRLPANETIDVSFTATKAGVFPLYCSVSCGSGEVTTGEYAGEVRGHFEHITQFIVAAIESLTGK